jgi:hypothetical protein
MVAPPDPVWGRLLPSASTYVNNINQ